MPSHQFSRRTFLRGVGVSMALPWMESINVWGDTPPAATRPASEAPARLAVVFSGNGFHSREWWAKGEGKAMELGRVLTPLADFRERLLFVRGLYNEEAQKGNIHSSQTGNLISGAPLAVDRLVKDDVNKGDACVLDAVLSDAKDLRRNISAGDQRKLDEYLESV